MGVCAARAAGLSVELLDAGVAGPPVPGVTTVRCHDPRGDTVAADAMSTHDAARLFDAGRELGTRLASSGLLALGEVGVANTTIAANLACALLDADPQAIVGLGAGADTEMLNRKRTVVETALRRARAAHDRALRDPIIALAALGGPEFAVLAGVVTGAAAGRAVVVLDGLATSVAALLAVHAEPATAASLVAGQHSRERGHGPVLTELGCEPLLDLRIRAGEGVGACMAATLIRQGLTIRSATARVNY
jgi:nicotinate-nucleotide--dimethylbenzimidazole phosphoribosyltransferase